MYRIRLLTLLILTPVATLFTVLLYPGSWLNRLVSIGLCSFFSFQSGLCVSNLAQWSERAEAKRPPSIENTLLESSSSWQQAQREREFDQVPTATPSNNRQAPSSYPSEPSPDYIRPDFRGPERSPQPRKTATPTENFPSQGENAATPEMDIPAPIENLPEVTEMDVALAAALFQLPDDRRTPENVLARANQLLGQSAVSEKDLPTLPTKADVDVAKPEGAIDLQDVAVFQAASELPADERTPENIAMRVNALLGENKTFSNDQILAIPGGKMPSEKEPQLAQRDVPENQTQPLACFSSAADPQFEIGDFEKIAADALQVEITDIYYKTTYQIDFSREEPYVREALYEPQANLPPECEGLDSFKIKISPDQGTGNLETVDGETFSWKLDQEKTSRSSSNIETTNEENTPTECSNGLDDDDDKLIDRRDPSCFGLSSNSSGNNPGGNNPGSSNSGGNNPSGSNSSGNNPGSSNFGGGNSSENNPSGGGQRRVTERTIDLDKSIEELACVLRVILKKVLVRVYFKQILKYYTGGFYKGYKPKKVFKWIFEKQDKIEKTFEEERRKNCGDGNGKTWGEPHLVTFDRHHYDFQAVGEFTLVKSIDNNLEIQVRQTPWGNKPVSANTAVAMKVGGSKVAFYANKPDPIKVNGQPISETSDTVDLSGGGWIERLDQKRYEVIWPTGDTAQVTLRRGKLVDVRPSLLATRTGQVTGLLGDFNGNQSDEFKTRDGEQLPANPNFDELYQIFGNSWRISQQESLFDYDSGESTQTFTDLAFPSQPVSANDLTRQERETAKAVCQAAGVTDPEIFEDCILDVALTGDEEFAESAASTEQGLKDDPDEGSTDGDSVEAPPSESNLIAFYPFEGNATDASGNNADGVVSGATLTSSGFEGQAYEFDGFDDFIRAEVNINPSVHPQLTLGAWARAEEFSNPATIVSHDDRGFDRTLNIDTRGGGLGWSAFSGRGRVLGFEPVTLGDWTFITALYDQPSGEVTFYVDEQVFSKSGTLGEGFDFIEIGRNPGFGELFTGAIDNVFIFDRLLSETEIIKIREEGATAIFEIGGND